ncbi:MAG: TetR/AcrR family transcriptional regulator [Acidimicrobiales bacterium]
MTSARERIIDATLTLVSELGLAGVTMVAVAKTAGVARATLYNHYPDVPSILADAATAHNQHAIDGLTQALAVVSTPTKAIEQLVRHIAAISSHGHTLATHHGFPPELRDQLSAFETELERRLRSILTDGIASGDFRHDLDPDATALLLRHALTGVSELVAATPERAAHIVDDATATLLAAITARPENPQ